MPGVAGEFVGQRLARGTREFWRGRLDDSENQLFAVERVLELIVALRQSRSGEISLLMSVVMAKCLAA